MLPKVSPEHLERAVTTVTKTSRACKIYIHFNRFHKGNTGIIWHLIVGGKSAFVGAWKKMGNVRTWSEFAGIDHPQPSAFVVAHGRLEVKDGVAYILP